MAETMHSLKIHARFMESNLSMNLGGKIDGNGQRVIFVVVILGEIENRRDCVKNQDEIAVGKSWKSAGLDRLHSLDFKLKFVFKCRSPSMLLTRGSRNLYLENSSTLYRS